MEKRNLDTLCIHAGYQPKKRRAPGGTYRAEHHLCV